MVSDGAIPAMMTPEEIKHRIEEAGDTLRRLQKAGLYPDGFRTAWPEYVTEGWWGLTAMDVDTGRAADTMVRPSPPSAARISRLDEVERWIDWLGDPYEVARLVEVFGHTEERARYTVGLRRTVVWCKAGKMHNTKIAERVRRNRNYVKQTYDEAVERIAQRLSVSEAVKAG